MIAIMSGWNCSLSRYWICFSFFTLWIRTWDLLQMGDLHEVRHGRKEYRILFIHWKNKYYNLWAMVIFIIQQYPQTSSAATLMKSLDFGSQIAGIVMTHCISVSTKIGWTFSRWSAWISSILRKRILCAKISKARYEFPWSSLIVVFLFKTYICTKDWI